MILLFSDDVQFGNDTARALRGQGLPVVSHDPDLLPQICRHADFCGVILDGRHTPLRFEQLSEKLFADYPDAPVLFLTQPGVSVYPCALKTACLDHGVDPLQVLHRFCRDCMGEENYATYALQHDGRAHSFTYLGYPLPLSDYEYRLLLCLFRNAPHAVRTDDLLSNAFPNGSTPRHTLWTLVKRINQSAQRISGLRLVQSVYGTGYRLSDGIVARSPSSSQGERSPS